MMLFSTYSGWSLYVHIGSYWYWLANASSCIQAKVGLEHPKTDLFGRFAQFEPFYGKRNVFQANYAKVQMARIFWSLRDDNRPHRSISPNKTMLGLCRPHVGGMLGPCWLCVGLCWAHVQPRWAVVGPMLRHVGRFWATYVEACWANLEPMSGHVRPMLAHVAPMLGPFWAMLGPSLAT